MRFSSVQRVPSAAECRYLRSKILWLRRFKARSWWRLALGVAMVCGALMALTLVVATDLPPTGIATVWFAIGVLIFCWNLADEWRCARERKRRATAYERVIARNSCEEWRIVAKRVWLFEECEDEGPAYAFELTAGGVVTITGQDYYEDQRFPNADFSLVDFPGDDGRPVDGLVVKHGSKLLPERVIRPAERSRKIAIEHLDFFDGGFDEVCRMWLAPEKWPVREQRWLRNR